MKTASLIIGIIAISGMFIAFIPCLGALNWLNIPLSIFGLLLGIIAMAQSKDNEPKGSAIAGIILCAVSMIFGLLRLILGGGIL